MNAITKTTKNDGEYRVRLFVDGNYQAGSDYFTDCKIDAKETAKAMVDNCTSDTTKEENVDDETRAIRKGEQEDFEEITEHTIWTATQDLDIDNLETETGRILNVLDMLSDRDDFLQRPCKVENGIIFFAGCAYRDADEVNETAQALRITLRTILVCMDMIKDGFGRDAVSDELGLSKWYRPCEYDLVLKNLGLNW